MVVNSIFDKPEYPVGMKEREKIAKQYNDKVAHMASEENDRKDFCITLIIDIFAILAAIMIFMVGDVHILLKLLYSVPAIIYSIYDAYLIIKGIRNTKDVKGLYKKKISFLILVNVYIYIGIYIFGAMGLKDKFTNETCFLSWIIFMILTAGSFIKAKKDSPKRFINDFLHKKNKYYSRQSWALNLTRILIVLFCLIRPYMLIMALAAILTAPYFYYLTYIVYTYLQYDEVQNLLR